MTFDLGRAMRRKEEVESARLLDFAFRRRARATRMLARRLAVDDADAAELAALLPEDAIPARLAETTGRPLSEVAAAFADCLRRAHEELVAERGDPTPHRLG